MLKKPDIYLKACISAESADTGFMNIHRIGIDRVKFLA